MTLSLDSSHFVCVVVCKVWAGLVQAAIPFPVGHGGVDSVEVEACAAGGVYIGLAPREGRNLESLEALVLEDDHLPFHMPTLHVALDGSHNALCQSRSACHFRIEARSQAGDNRDSEVWNPSYS